MAETVVVYEARVTEARWQPVGWSFSDVEELLAADPEELELALLPGFENLTTYSSVEGLPGALVVRTDEETVTGPGYFAWYCAHVVALAGDAEGCVLSIPDVPFALPPAGVESADPADPGTWSLPLEIVESGLQRIKPFDSTIICGQWIQEGDGRVLNFDDWYMMEFPDWLAASGASGLELKEVARRSFD